MRTVQTVAFDPYRKQRAAASPVAFLLIGALVRSAPCWCRNRCSSLGCRRPSRDDARRSAGERDRVRLRADLAAATEARTTLADNRRLPASWRPRTAHEEQPCGFRFLMASLPPDPRRAVACARRG
jgi:hypothetical protein